MRTLAIHIGGIGDFILTFPALHALAQQGPLDVAGNPDRVALPAHFAIAQDAHDSRVFDFDSLFTTPRDRFRDFVSRYDRVVLFMRDDGEVRERIRNCGVTEVIALPGIPPDDWTRHASTYFCEKLNVATSDWTPPLPEKSRAPKSVIIHPGSGGKRKNWPLEHFRALSHALTDRGFMVQWLRGPAEELDYPSEVTIIESPTLCSLADTLAATERYIGNDSGVSHLAGISGCMSTVIFGPTNPSVWCPMGRDVAPITGTPWPTLDAVIQIALRD